MRDPRITPMPGDVLRKFSTVCTVTRVHEGFITVECTAPWQQGILFFRRWAADADVVRLTETPVPACCFCTHAITALDAQTVCADGPCHTRCWNVEEGERLTRQAECDDAEGFRDRVPCTTRDVRANDSKPLCPVCYEYADMRPTTDIDTGVLEPLPFCVSRYEAVMQAGTVGEMEELVRAHEAGCPICAVQAETLKRIPAQSEKRTAVPGLVA